MKLKNTLKNLMPLMHNMPISTMPSMRNVTLLAIVACFATAAIAEDLGTYGPVWNIGEPDAIDAIKNKIRKMEKDGSLKKRQEEYKNRSIDGIKNPRPLPGISTSMVYRERIFDPTYTYTETMRDETGKILVPAGTRLNPLDYQPLGKRLVFIDARDKRQVVLAKKILDANPEDKVILTAGSFIELSRTFGRRVYFDQKGALTRRFEIVNVPAVIAQSGRMLTITQGIK